MSEEEIKIYEQMEQEYEQNGGCEYFADLTDYMNVNLKAGSDNGDTPQCKKCVTNCLITMCMYRNPNYPKELIKYVVDY